MVTSTVARTPFDQGVKSVQLDSVPAANPFAEGSVEFRNFELGRTFAERRTRSTPFPLQRPASR